jgi:hypothetical protein
VQGVINDLGDKLSLFADGVATERVAH